MKDEKLKTYELYRCWNNPKGEYMITAPSMTFAAKALGCSVYHLKTYSYTHTFEDCKDKLEDVGISESRKNPGVVFKREKYNAPYFRLEEKTNKKDKTNELSM